MGTFFIACLDTVHSNFIAKLKTKKVSEVTKIWYYSFLNWQSQDPSPLENYPLFFHFFLCSLFSLSFFFYSFIFFIIISPPLYPLSLIHYLLSLSSISHHKAHWSRDWSRSKFQSPVWIFFQNFKFFLPIFQVNNAHEGGLYLSCG